MIANIIRDSPLYVLLSVYANGTLPDGDYPRARAVLLDACMDAAPKDVHHAVQHAFGMTMPEDYRRYVLEIASLYYLLAPKAPAGMGSLIFAMTHLDSREWLSGWTGKRPGECPGPASALNFMRKRFRRYADDTPAEAALSQTIHEVTLESFTDCLFHDRYRLSTGWDGTRPEDTVFRIQVVRAADGHVEATHDRGKGVGYSQATNHVVETWISDVKLLFASEYLEREGNVALLEVLGWSPTFIATMEMIAHNAQQGHAFSG